MPASDAKGFARGRYRSIPARPWQKKLGGIGQAALGPLPGISGNA